MKNVYMSLIYGKAQSGDFDRLNELFIEMLRTIYNTEQVDGYAKGDMDRFFDGRDEWVCVAIDNDNIIAFLSIEVHHEEEEYIYLDDLSVTSSYRNNGIGTSLIKRAEEYAEKIRVSKIYFHVEKTNASAFRLYQRLGYSIKEEQGTRYLMSKEL